MSGAPVREIGTIEPNPFGTEQLVARGRAVSGCLHCAVVAEIGRPREGSHRLATLQALAQVVAELIEQAQGEAHRAQCALTFGRELELRRAQIAGVPVR
jgi:hypothetical protein